MAANADEARHAFEKAQQFLLEGRTVRAVKMLEISQRLHPTVEASELLRSARNRIQPDESLPDNPTRGRGFTPINIITRSIAHLKELESRYILPEMRSSIRMIIAIFLGLACWKIFFRKNFSFGALPGDFNYTSTNLQVHAPLVSCFLISFMFNALIRAFQ
eukprot:gene12727-26811_t